jgi:hypothetical protein
MWDRWGETLQVAAVLTEQTQLIGIAVQPVGSGGFQHSEDGWRPMSAAADVGLLGLVRVAGFSEQFKS